MNYITSRWRQFWAGSLPLAASLLLAVPAAAQTVDLARMFSTTSPGGTARGTALGGATSTLGADLSTITTNPAGLGLYTRSEFVLTPTLRITDHDHSFLGNQINETGARFGFNNLGVALFIPGSGGKLTSWTFGVGFNQVANFERRTNITGVNRFNSIMDNWAALAQSDFRPDGNGYFFGNPYAQAAYDGFAIDFFNGPNFVPLFSRDSVRSANGGFVPFAFEQEVQWRERGRINQWNVAAGFNFDDRVHLGFSLDIVDLYYRNDITYSETDINNRYIRPNGFGFDYLTYEDIIEHTGAGIGGTFGIIYQPADFVRVGGSIKTPQYVSMTSRAQPLITAYYDNGQTDAGAETVAQEYTYYMTLPFRATLGATFLAKKWALLTVDAEYTDFRNSGFDTNPNEDVTSAVETQFARINQQIDNIYRPGWNFRSGVELRPTDELYLRGGYAWYTSPFSRAGQVGTDLAYGDLRTYNDLTGATTNLLRVSGERQMISAGIGWRERNWFVDFTWQQQISRDIFTPYGTPATVFDVIVETNGRQVPGGLGQIDYSAGISNGGAGLGYAPGIVSNRLERSNFLLTVGFLFGRE